MSHKTIERHGRRPAAALKPEVDDLI